MENNINKNINSFDCKKFADYAQNEAKKYLPDRISEDDKNFILDTFWNSAFKTVLVLSEDKSLKVDSEEKINIFAKYILEWVFKTAVTIVEANIPAECRHGFMLDIGYVAFDIAKDVSNIESITNEQMSLTIEYHVINKVKTILAELQQNGVINERTKTDFLNHPYIDKSKKNIQFAIYGDIY